jgi:peptidoglycan/xylan/chitin deacetylase (PgdA/CDA1 family)
MVTVSEYNKILRSLYEKDYILVSLNDVWSEYTDDNGARGMKKNTLMLPEGKKPLVLSFDDLSFYPYMSGYGFMDKYIIGADGEIWAAGTEPSGSPVISQDLTAVTILDKFIKEHPGFSLGGVKGCIALTGYEGILGYRTQTDRREGSLEAQISRMREIARVRPVVDKLKETGWYFASHSWGHINFEKASLTAVKNDAQRWMEEVGSLVGETALLIYPHGGRLDGGDVNKTGQAFLFYHELGFRVFASVGREPFSQIKSNVAAVICDRMAVDGIALRTRRDRFMRFYDAAEVFDHSRPAEYGRNW